MGLFEYFHQEPIPELVEQYGQSAGQVAEAEAHWRVERLYNAVGSITLGGLAAYFRIRHNGDIINEGLPALGGGSVIMYTINNWTLVNPRLHRRVQEIENGASPDV